VMKVPVPLGWVVRGGAYWRDDFPANPVSMAIRYFNPDGFEAAEAFPPLLFAWDPSPILPMQISIGGSFYGYVYHPPMQTDAAVRTMLLPQIRPIPGLQVLDTRRCDEIIPRLFPPDIPEPNVRGIQREALRYQLRYTLDGAQVEEALYVVGEYIQVVFPMGWQMAQQIYWGLKAVHSIQARAGGLDEMEALREAMWYHVEHNPQFQARVGAISQSLTQDVVAQINAAGRRALDLGRQYAQLGDAQWASYQQRQRESDQVWQGYRDREGRTDAAWQKRIDAVRGTARYDDPYSGQQVELDDAHRYAWASPDGAYLLTDDPTDPNVGSVRPWTQLRPSDK
jgi:hypothetical protein